MTKMPEAPEGYFFRVGPREAVVTGWDYYGRSFGVSLYRRETVKRLFGKTKTRDILIESSYKTDKNETSIANAAHALLSGLRKRQAEADFIARNSGDYPPKKEIA